MINELFFMNGYGIYVWSAFVFTFLSFASLYVVIRTQYIRERKKFITKFGNLNPESNLKKKKRPRELTTPF